MVGVKRNACQIEEVVAPELASKREVEMVVCAQVAHLNQRHFKLVGGGKHEYVEHTML